MSCNRTCRSLCTSKASVAKTRASVNSRRKSEAFRISLFYKSDFERVPTSCTLTYCLWYIALPQSHRKKMLKLDPFSGVNTITLTRLSVCSSSSIAELLVLILSLYQHPKDALQRPALRNSPCSWKPLETLFLALHSKEGVSETNRKFFTVAHSSFQISLKTKQYKGSSVPMWRTHLHFSSDNGVSLQTLERHSIK